MRIDLSEEEGIDVQMAPLIDCVFLLLIFFLVATTLKKIERELPLKLPESSAAIRVKSSADVLVIGVTKRGRLFLGDQAVTQAVLHERLRKAASANPEQRVRIDADRLTPFQYVVQVFDLCQFEGLRNVGVHTKDEPRPE